MVSVEEINHWLYANGLTAPSVSQLQADLPRWPRRLSERGVVSITDSNVDNELIELVYEARQKHNPQKGALARMWSAQAHHHRNLIGLRPWKP